MIWLVGLSIITLKELVAADVDAIKNLTELNNKGDIIK